MLEWFAIDLGDLDPMTRFLFDSAIKGAVVFAAAGALALALRRRTAAARHLVWSLAVVAALGLPVLSAMPAVVGAPPAGTTSRRGRRAGPERDWRACDRRPKRLDAARPAVDRSRPASEGETTRAVVAMAAPRARRWRTSVSSAGRWPWMVPRWAWVPWLWGAGALLSCLADGGRAAEPVAARSVGPAADGGACATTARATGRRAWPQATGPAGLEPGVESCL